MTCIRTGADIYLSEEDVLVHGDLYDCGSVYVFICIQGWRQRSEFATPGARYSLMMKQFEECGATTIVAEKEHCSDFNYHGWEL